MKYRIIAAYAPCGMKATRATLFPALDGLAESMAYELESD
jgi:hypothetical protein